MPPDPVEPVDPVVPQVAPPPPNTATLLPHACTGALTGAFAELPVPAVPLAAPAGQPDDGCDPTATVLPQTVAGALAGAFAVLPDPEPVPALESLVLPAVAAVPVGQPEVGCDPTATVLPHTNAGALTGAFTV